MKNQGRQSFCSTLEATQILGHPGDHWRVYEHVVQGRLKQITLSPRKRFYARAEVEALARRWAAFARKAA